MQTDQVVEACFLKKQELRELGLSRPTRPKPWLFSRSLSSELMERAASKWGSCVPLGEVLIPISVFDFQLPWYVPIYQFSSLPTRLPQRFRCTKVAIAIPCRYSANRVVSLPVAAVQLAGHEFSAFGYCVAGRHAPSMSGAKKTFAGQPVNRATASLSPDDL
jgi:hypothetical protein